MSQEQTTQPKTSILQRLTGGLMKIATSIMQYGKEVVTGQKLMEGLKQNDGAVDGWLSHGANELATVILTGNPAPVYTRSPLSQDELADVSPASVEAEPGGLEPLATAITSHAEARDATHHEVTVNQNAGEDMQQTLFQSSLSNLVDRVRSLFIPHKSCPTKIGVALCGCVVDFGNF